MINSEKPSDCAFAVRGLLLSADKKADILQSAQMILTFVVPVADGSDNFEIVICLSD